MLPDIVHHGGHSGKDKNHAVRRPHPIPTCTKASEKQKVLGAEGEQEDSGPSTFGLGTAVLSASHRPASCLHSTCSPETSVV